MAGKKSHSGEVVRFRMTRAGWLFLAGAVLIGLATLRSQSPLLYVVFGGMMGALHVSAFMARRMIAAVRIHQEIPSRVWQHQTVHVSAFLQNTRRRTACLAMGFRLFGPKEMESAQGFCAHLGGGESFRAGLRFSARRRGRFAFDGLLLHTTFPFGLIEASKTIKDASSLIVWPARGAIRRRVLHRGAVEVSNLPPTPASGGQDEFFGLREYRDGDNPRWIHWRRSAGRAAPVIREMSQSLPDVLWVLLDTFQTAASDSVDMDRERLIRFAATLVDHAFSRDYRVGLATVTGNRVLLFPPGAGRGWRRDLLDALADVDGNAYVRLGELLGSLRPVALRQAQAVLITPDARRLDVLDAPHLNRFRAACRNLQIIDALSLEDYFVDEPLADAGRADDAGQMSSAEARHAG